MDHEHESPEQPGATHGHQARHDSHTGNHQPDQAAAASHAGHGAPVGHSTASHGVHQAGHTGHELIFRNRFWICLALSVPVLLYSAMLQEWFNFTMPVFPGSRWIEPVFATIVFLYGGLPFLRMAAPELRNRQPGMMTLIFLAISVAYIYSLAALVIDPEGGFFWELVTLIVIMLLGHWLEMRSIRQASGVLYPSFGILLSPALGALFMSLSTVIVAINAQTLRRAELSDRVVASEI